MISQLVGAVVRAILVLVVISTPSLLIPGTSEETTQIVTLIGLFAAVFTFSEYASTYPGLIEFRDAQPYNRVRMVSVFIALFALSVVVSAGDVSTLSLVINATGFIIAEALDFPFSPLRVLMGQLPPDVDPRTAAEIEIMAGLSALIGLLTLSIFAILVRLQQWPNRRSAFNVWINLPTFDPTTGGDIVTRLLRDARVNIILGFALPYILPVLASVGAAQLEMSILDSPQTLVWTITAWMFLPVTMFMRGMAMGRVADMINSRRKRLVAKLDPNDGYAAA
ncbi:hypothetical protein GTA62_10015 [Roseobacter sp. HKCCD9010]|uniref:hypothetical protein n=1 Tax=unclassified Roseobacter TaxID=196798 RepID=UPI001492A72C|nr:hypothetical protein [Rhodobacterales bacterium HKCCD4356]NNV12726.1 hypothetical protein [Roseobacter sp. HKCCD7357]NNV16670.1 hypothetical protein [Roseobacter sp. HKCCD8768]NNV26698.1 hypothetical protein [Roseobacter sp. HKCCD8192]NNV30389.1 hypothetical protein [Roseobacter sp. HKCCD9061]NNV34774.1 hypothetical protein [Roseobacter sp. HKCCD9073]NNV39476.1 hypothetical protein [Roseobacter sp. HKCCD9054]NNV42980.1 hypothetical protein [Roseobacter sp. HKCCD6497]NNV47449.1 hypothetic